MKKMTSILMAVVLGASLSACSTSPTMKELTEDSIAASQARAEANEKALQKQNAKMEKSLNAIPGWFLDVPQPDETGVYAVGEGESGKSRVAMKKAMLDAEFGLAKAYNQELTGTERAITEDGGAVSSQYVQLVDKLVAEVPVVGIEVVHREVKVIDGQYRAFVLVKLPHEQFNSVLQQKKRKSGSVKAEDQFKELERRLDRRRQQLREDAIINGKPVSPEKELTPAEVMGKPLEIPVGSVKSELSSAVGDVVAKAEAVGL